MNDIAEVARIYEYPNAISFIQVSKATGIDYTSIRRAVSEKKKSAGGYK